ncbi:conserved Plasmodium protein, unknown function [Plasmodium relictum]|uniref:Uncharacterized protein n=1 Tax=Plasmodium relictum TaxID=85471 RepID=A0A1J1H4J7_PLARL|nr:conserved Plasmodium protein, unknown function [Plasmodium relictum]CRG99844.1 conserved Plasmodium protein, unknown function [Plasmodium relictum]
MAELIASFLSNFGLLFSDAGCCSKQKVKLKNINFCGFEELLNNKTKKVLNEKKKISNFINICNSKEGYSISKYYLDGCIKKKDVIYNIEGSNLNKSNNCSIYMNNREDDESNTVIDLDNEILIGNFQFNSSRDDGKSSFDNNQYSINYDENNLEIQRMNKNTDEKIKRLKNSSNDLYENESINNSSSNKKNTTDKNYNYIISKQNAKKTNMLSNDKSKNRKKNLFSYPTTTTKFNFPLSHPSGSYKDAASDASSEFFSVVSNLKSNI